MKEKRTQLEQDKAKQDKITLTKIEYEKSKLRNECDKLLAQTQRQFYQAQKGAQESISKTQ